VYSASSTLEKVAQPSLEMAQRQGAELVNWASTDQRGRFLLAISALADPVPRKRGGRHSGGDPPVLFV
jgi:hypothetical protein